VRSILTALCLVKHSDDDRGGLDERRLLCGVHLRELDLRAFSTQRCGRWLVVMYGRCKWVMIGWCVAMSMIGVMWLCDVVV
jgi:hypothetical protein